LQSVAARVETPAFVVDHRRVVEAMRQVDAIKADTGCRFLYALKPLADTGSLRLMKGHVDGFAASSLFEATLARTILGEAGSVHITTPGFRPDEMVRLGSVCDYVVLNSMSQFQRFRNALLGRTSIGVRINPELSFVKDARYNPCRSRSKLGVPMRQLTQAFWADSELRAALTGIHFHSNSDATTFTPLLKTVRHIVRNMDPVLRRMSWVNMGGGYLFNQANLEPLYDAIGLLRDRYGIDVFMEPGAAIVREAGSLVATVIDMVKNDGEVLAFLDTTVNHMPEVYEYQYEPDVLGHHKKGRYRYQLVGSTCLAGDIFGKYAFDTPLEIGSPVVFPNMGAYSLVKAHMFNGVNLPTIYTVTQAGDLHLQKRFTYDDFLSRCGVSDDADL
jgi:carboxynorspermidine decarboxylase